MRARRLASAGEDGNAPPSVPADATRRGATRHQALRALTFHADTSAVRREIKPTQHHPVLTRFAPRLSRGFLFISTVDEIAHLSRQRWRTLTRLLAQPPQPLSSARRWDVRYEQPAIGRVADFPYLTVVFDAEHPKDPFARRLRCSLHSLLVVGRWDDHSRSPSPSRWDSSRARASAVLLAYRDNMARERHPAFLMSPVSEPPAASHE